MLADRPPEPIRVMDCRTGGRKIGAGDATTFALARQHRILILSAGLPNRLCRGRPDTRSPHHIGRQKQQQWIIRRLLKFETPAASRRLLIGQGGRQKLVIASREPVPLEWHRCRQPG